ncbi:unnamed protein product [Rhizophagus irregularis]|nr:unnamed protein product [Rhizophagus irregularis]
MECPSIQAKDNTTEKKRYIVIFDKEVKNAAEDHYEMMKECYKTRVQSIIKADESTNTVFDQSVIRDFSVNGSIQGYSSYFTPEFAKAVGKMKNVILVEEEKKVKVDKILHAVPQRFSKRYFINKRAEDDDPFTNLDRIDQAKRPLDGKFVYPDSAREGVNIFIVDTGVLLTHEQFDGRAKLGGSFCKNCTTRNVLDTHGTFVANVAAGNTVGVASKANIIDVRVLDAKGEGTSINMIEGLCFVIDQHKNGKNKNSVVNMSLIVDPVLRALNHVVKEITDAGIHMDVAAGNDSKDACKQSPASAPSAIAVGATEKKSDAVTDFSNFGKCVDIFSLGRNVYGAASGYNNDYLVFSGTSLSSPLVAGILALLISKSGNKPPDALTKDLITLSTKGVITGLKKGSPDAFLRTPAL